jgi:hypothetical protein
MIVALTSAQLSMAAHVAVMRRIANQQNNVKPKYGAPTGIGSWEFDLNACAAEVAVAKHFNLFWCGTVNDYGALDVGGLINVRQTHHAHGRLRLHPPDCDDVPFVLATGTNGTFNLRGWLFASEGKQQRWWCDPTGDARPAFFVPQHELHDMEVLATWLGGVKEAIRADQRSVG